MEHSDLTEKIIGSAYTVYNKMGFGFLESVYENALLVELRKQGIAAESQRRIDVFYEDEIVGHFVADIAVEEKVILELKSVKNLNEAHEVQLVNYLVATSTPVGLLIDFGEKGVEVRRKVGSLSNARGSSVSKSC